MKNIPLYGSAAKAYCILAFSILLAVLLNSCESYVEVDAPPSQLQGTLVYEDVGTATAALTNIYSSLQRNALVNGGANGLSILMGSYADELVSYSNYGLPEETFFANNLQASNESIFALWSETYSLIYASNAVIEGVGNSAAIAQSDKNLLIGEALFVRSYLHFYLLQLFGDAPYVTQTDYRINATIGKTSTDVLYDFLAADLVQAQQLLPSAYSVALRVRPNRSVATALLARVYLYSQKYGAAEEAASMVIADSGLYAIEPSLSDVFLINSRSTLWQLMPALANMNTLEGEHFIFTAGPPPARALSASLYAAFEPGDLRREQWLGTVQADGETWHHPFKYRQPATTDSSQEYSIQFRLEEMYLIRAEAAARQGNFTAALEDLNIIRNRAGLPDSTLEGDSLLAAILQERRVELFTEHGHRFFDLKRTGQLDAHLSGIKPGWNTTDSFLPLPQKELSLNRNLLPQNTGY